MGQGGAPTLSFTREMANCLLEATGKTIDELKTQIETTLKPASMDIPGAKVTVVSTSKTALVRGINVLGYDRGLATRR